MCFLMHYVLFAVFVAGCAFGIACCFLWLCVGDVVASGGQLGKLWAPKMVVLRPFWEALGPFWEALGPIWEALGPSWRNLGQS